MTQCQPVVGFVALAGGACRGSISATLTLGCLFVIPITVVRKRACFGFIFFYFRHFFLFFPGERRTASFLPTGEKACRLPVALEPSPLALRESRSQQKQGKNPGQRQLQRDRVVIERLLSARPSVIHEFGPAGHDQPAYAVAPVLPAPFSATINAGQKLNHVLCTEYILYSTEACRGDEVPWLPAILSLWFIRSFGTMDGLRPEKGLRVGTCEL